jgi:RimJ/RimL family protein N-acetyltransferase
MMPTLKTERLLLRPFRAEDAPAVHARCGEWNVARMLTRVDHPYTREMAESWIESHEEAWNSGEEITFCVDLDREAIGAVSLRRKETGVYVLGYWLGAPWWGKGLATEAARCAVRFAFEELGAENLTSGHFLDNPASGRVLEKCGFRYTDEGTEHSEARGEAVMHRNLECGLDDNNDQAELS